METDLLQILETHWGYKSFREPQGQIVEAVTQGHDVLALLPTGGGKSVCFQVPGLARGGLSIVVSPLIALMNDQVNNLRKAGIKAMALHSAWSRHETELIIEEAAAGKLQFLYLSPERLQTDFFKTRLPDLPLQLLAVDEAHCISQWGYDFRPPYLQIKTVRDAHPKVPIVALTASATPQVQADIVNKLELKNHKRFTKSFARPNLVFAAVETEDKAHIFTKALKKYPGTAIAYVRTRKSTQKLAKWLLKNGETAAYYHAGLTPEQRNITQQRWLNNQTRIITATTAFGMGIDKPDVRLVLHTELPESLEAYYQEAGRAGRDGQKARALVLYNQDDIHNLYQRIETAYPPKEEILRVYNALCNFHQLAVGAGHMATFIFKPGPLIKNYKLDAYTAYHCLRRLESEGLIQMNDAFHAPSRVQFDLEPIKMYDFQLHYPHQSTIIKLLLRLYGGELYNHPVQISESQLAEILKLPAAQIIDKLKWLQNNGIINYIRASGEPRVTFLEGRFSNHDVPIDWEKLKNRKKADIARADAMVGYLQQENQCRTAYISAYFGENNLPNCGICDHCLHKGNKQKAHQQLEPLKIKILGVMGTEPVFPQALLRKLNLDNEPDGLKAIKQLLNEGRIQYDLNGRIKAQQV